MIHTVGEMLHIDVLRAWIDWLMVLPAGLKLNYNAGRKLGGAVLSIIETWEGVTTFLTPFEPIIVAGIGIFGMGGASLLAALASDVLELATLHLYILYTAFAALHNRQTSLIGALWRLFRGKKRNILRSRVDNNDYDLTQLLLGTLLFTVVFFLFPTTLVYYLFFSSVWMGILITHGILWWLITGLNNIPVGILWRITNIFTIHTKNGIDMLLQNYKNSNIQHWGYSIISKNNTIPLSNPCRSPDAVFISLLGSDAKYTVESTTTNAVVKRYRPGSSDYWYGEDNHKEKGNNSSTSSLPTNTWYILYSHSTSIGTLFISPLREAIQIVSQKYSFGTILRAVIYGERPTASKGVTKTTSTNNNGTGSGSIVKKKEGTSSSNTGTTPTVSTQGSTISTTTTNVPNTNLPTSGYTGTWKDYVQAINILADRWCYGYQESEPEKRQEEQQESKKIR